MKKLFTLLLLFWVGAVLAQNNTKQQDIQNLLTVMQMKNTTQATVGKLIDMYQKQKPAVPQQVWNKVKQSVDYTPYMAKVATIFDNNYTQPEVKNLIDIAIASKPKLPQFKNIVQHQLYEVGKDFGKKINSIVQEKLKSKGF